MNNDLENLKKWLNDLSDFEFPKWNELPELPLYMDQVMMYLESKLEPLNIEDEENVITPCMINNYVKGDVVPNPKQKKYGKEHLSKILITCAMKQVLSISDIRTLFKLLEQYDEQDENIYSSFQSIQASSMSNIVNETLSQLENENNSKDLEKQMIYSALKLVIEAEVKKIIANKILEQFSFTEKDKNKEEKADKKAKQEEEKKKKEREKEEEKLQRELVKALRVK